jgi:hypothetical protein
MGSIIAATGIRGVYMWSINDYYMASYDNAGNPINFMCDWTNRLSPSLGLTASSPIYSDSTMCQ